MLKTVLFNLGAIAVKEVIEVAFTAFTKKNGVVLNVNFNFNRVGGNEEQHKRDMDCDNYEMLGGDAEKQQLVQRFEMWKIRHNRQYGSESENQKKMANYKQNLQFVAGKNREPSVEEEPLLDLHPDDFEKKAAILMYNYPYSH